jgi:hypothetical protein
VPAPFPAPPSLGAAAAVNKANQCVLPRERFLLRAFAKSTQWPHLEQSARMRARSAGWRRAVGRWRRPRSTPDAA